MSTAIPSSLNLGLTKPTTIPAYSRRVESIATNAQTFSENSIANIVLDTSTPGSFLDPMQSLIQFDIELTNMNPYIDYVNLSTSGMASVIQDFRIICQGTPIEEIYDYNLMFEMFMDLGGHMQEEFKMYMENGWRAPVNPGEPDLNFVKPPMVDREGVIMHPKTINIFGDPNEANTHWQEGNQLLDVADASRLAFYRPAPATAALAKEHAYARPTHPEEGLNYIRGQENGFKSAGQRGPAAGVTPEDWRLAQGSKVFIYKIENDNASGGIKCFFKSTNQPGIEFTTLSGSAAGYAGNDYVVMSGLTPFDETVDDAVSSKYVYKIISTDNTGANPFTILKKVTGQVNATGAPEVTATAILTTAGAITSGVDTSANATPVTMTPLLYFTTSFKGCVLTEIPWANNTGFFDQANQGYERLTNSGNYMHMNDFYATKLFSSNAPGNVRAHCWTNRIDNTYVTWPDTLRPEPLCRNESRQRQEGDTKKYRVQDYMDFLANVKNIPVGIKSNVSFTKNQDGLQHSKTAGTNECNASAWNFGGIMDTLSVNHLAAASQSVKFTVSLPIFSGIIGCWAEKQFPSMLISPGSFYFQIKFANAENAFQTAMDPCRRILGTYRDYIPNCGLPNYYKTEFNGQNLAHSKINTISPPHDPSQGFLISTNMAITPAGAKGYDFAWNGIIGLNPKTAFGIYGRENMIGNSQYDTSLTRGYITNGATAGEEFQLTGHFGQFEGNTTGNAKPQYVPRRTPWLCQRDHVGFGTQCVKNNLTDLRGQKTTAYGYVRERDVCFGTYLPASTAQVRRTKTDFNFINSSNTNANESVKYTITNLKYIGMQTILPDEVTASIVRKAASSDISMHAQSVRTYKTILSQAPTQNLILPVKVASANSLWIIFQNQRVINNSHYCSMTRHCPFTSFTWNQGSTYAVGSDTVPIVKSIPTINPFQIQLRIGNELLPIQPMTCLQHVVTELLRSVHGLGDMGTELPISSSLRSFTWEDNSSTKPNDNTTYNCLKSGDFCVPYVPVEALDDQTITNNPIFMDYHNAMETGYGAFIAQTTGDPQFNDRGKYILPEFLPPISKFLLGFDLDTFPGTNDVARSGRYLGNAPLTLQMTNVHAANTPSISGSLTSGQDAIAATAVVLHDIRFSIMAGGQILSYY